MAKAVASEQGFESKLRSENRKRMARARSEAISAIQSELDQKGKVGFSKEDMGKLSGRVNEIVGECLQDVFLSIWHLENTAFAENPASFYFAPGYSQYTGNGSRRIDTTDIIINTLMAHEASCVKII